MLVYPFAKALLAVIMFVLGPVRVFGKRNVPRQGGVLILANHISDADPPAMGLAVPRRPHFMAKSELFHIPILGPLIKLLGAFPVNRGAPDRAALRKAIELLQQGAAVVMFPEGEVSETGEPLSLMPGAALIVRSAGVPVVCAGIKGTRKIMPYRKVVPRPAFGGVNVSFGEAKTFEKSASHEEILDWVRDEFSRLTGSDYMRDK